MKPWMSIFSGGILSAGSAGSARAAEPLVAVRNSPAAVPDTSAPLLLTGSHPPSYATAYQRALTCLKIHVSAAGLDARQTGKPASADTSAYVAFTRIGQMTTASTIVNRLARMQTLQGGWNQAVNFRAPAALGATAHTFWAEVYVAELSPGVEGSALRPSIEWGANLLVTSSSPVWGTFMQTPNSVGSAEENAVAVSALPRATQVAGTRAGRRLWNAHVVRARAGLIDNHGVSRTTTTDFLAPPLWNLERKTGALRRVVASLFGLGFAYQGYGAKVAPGYYTGTDWENGVSTCNDVMASVNAELPGVAEMQYNHRLTLQNADGGFGAIAHAPVGPEMGSFHRVPNASSVPVAAHYLLASQSLLRHHMIGFGWRSATISVAGQTIELKAPAGDHLDPRSPMHPGRRVGVLASDPNTVISSSKPPTVVSNETGMELNAAWQLTYMGYNVSLFWDKPNHAQNFYPRADLWANLKSFPFLVMSNNGVLHRDDYKAAFRKHANELQSGLAQDGRFLDLGDHGLAPLPPPFSLSVIPSTISRVKGENTDAIVSWQQAARRYYSSSGACAYHILATGGDGAGGMHPVAVGAQDGKGRIVLTTILAAGHAQDHTSIPKARSAWATQSLHSIEPPMESYVQTDRNLMRIMKRHYLAAQTHLYVELSYPSEYLPPPVGSQRLYAYLCPFTQAIAGMVESASVLGKTRTGKALKSANQGLNQYYDRYFPPPGYESDVASGGGGATFFDDHGWTELDLLGAYRDTRNLVRLKEAEVDTKFLAGGWNRTGSPPGGEYFNEHSQTRTQTAAGSFLDATLRLVLTTRNPKLLTGARSISAWHRKYIRALNGIYSDSMSPSGEVGGTPFTYDTGVVPEADVLLYRVTGQMVYLKRAQQRAVAAISVFVNPLNGVLAEDAGTANALFKAILLRALDMLWRINPNPLRISPLKRQAVLAIRYDCFASGVYGSNRTGVNNPQTAVVPLTQGGTLRLFGELAAMHPPATPLIEITRRRVDSAFTLGRNDCGCTIGPSSLTA